MNGSNKVSAKRLLTGGGMLFATALGFVIYSGAVSFSNWPWTTTQSFTSGEVLGFQIGSTKEDCFQNAIRLERNGHARGLNLVDADVGTYEERFDGTELQFDDFTRVRLSNTWHLALTGENGWLLLEFDRERLRRISKRRYRGPTE